MTSFFMASSGRASAVHRIPCWAAVVVAWLGLTFGSSAYVLDLSIPGKPLRWDFDQPSLVHTNTLNPATRSIRFFIASDAWSASNRIAEIEAVRASFDQWQAISGTQLRFEDAGLVDPSTPLNSSDHTNLVYWTRDDKLINGGRDDIRFSLALTYVTSTNGVIQEADIAINGRSYEWFTDSAQTSSTQQFVEATLLHEIGHFLGLDHSPLGGATMFATGGDGIDAQAGLAQDDIAAARALYGTEEARRHFGRFSGRVTSEGQGVFGAIVTLEDPSGNAVAANPSRFDGAFEFESIPPGAYTVRTSPLDPNDASLFLTRGRDLSLFFLTNAVETSFSLTTFSNVVVTAGQETRMLLPLPRGTPGPRITSIRVPSPPNLPVFHAPIAALVRPGQSNVVVGVFSTEFPQAGGLLRISGTGIKTGLTRLDSGGGLRGRSATVEVALDAAPGLRTLLVDWPDGKTSAAVGFLEVEPRVRDDNFDGLDDAFQRTHFARFTSAEAAPGADPDQDGLANSGEQAAGTDPNSAFSTLKIDQVRLDAGGANVMFRGVPGKQYRLLARDQFGTGSWQQVGGAVRSKDATTSLLDPKAREIRFYRVEVVP